LSFGYSKVLRYVMLVTPAAVVLFALVADGAVRFARGGRRFPGRKAAAILMLLLAAAGLDMGVARSLRTSFVDNRQTDIIRPLPGLCGIDYGRPR
jgi:hypothetical protein